jgi:hypothetical protein
MPCLVHLSRKTERKECLERGSSTTKHTSKLKFNSRPRGSTKLPMSFWNRDLKSPVWSDSSVSSPVHSILRGDEADSAVEGKGAAEPAWQDGCLTSHGRKIFSKIFGPVDDERIKLHLKEYRKALGWLRARCPTDLPGDREWAIIWSINPRWFGEELRNRIQNMLVVSSLLLTISTAITLYMSIEGTGAGAYRFRMYASIACSLVLFASVITGMQYMVEVLSRPYEESDKLVLVVNNWLIKDIYEALTQVGCLIFPIVLISPLWENCETVDALLLTVMAGLLAAYVLFLLYEMHMSVSRVQQARSRLFSSILRDNGDLRSEYDPDKPVPSVPLPPPVTRPVLSPQEGLSA